MSIFDKETESRMQKAGGEWIKGEEFNGDGLTLQIVKVERMKANNPKYGALATDSIVKNEYLEEGETFRYVFKNKQGVERKIDSKSMPLFIGFSSVREALEPGDWVHIKREGERDETRYYVEKVDAPFPQVPIANDDIDPENIPF